MKKQNPGPLAGVRVLEFAGLGPCPFAGMHLAQLGADVLVIDRPQARADSALGHNALNRGKRRLMLDLKSSPGQAAKLADRADILIEGFRPGVMERLCLGPEVLMQSSPHLVYGRMTGWGQSGPRAQDPGHDINYIGLSGALGAIGPAEAPIPPLNLLGDFGGGAVYLALGVVAALFEARQTGQGRVIDAAIVDGAAHLATMIHAMQEQGVWSDRRQSNLLDGAAPFYRCFECADAAWLALGPLEPQFFAALEAVLGRSIADHYNTAHWPALSVELAEIFAQQPRAHWLAHPKAAEACLTPVHSLAQAAQDPHLAARATFDDETRLPNAAPRFGSDVTSPGRPCKTISLSQALQDWPLREV